jgi:hypothetical protein
MDEACAIGSEIEPGTPAPRIDTLAMRTLHSYINLQAREAGKAVRIGRGPATVIGPNAVSQATLPRRIGTAFFARRNAAGSPIATRMGLFC